MNNKEEYLGMRQQGGIFTRITSLALGTVISTGFDSAGLGR